MSPRWQIGEEADRGRDQLAIFFPKIGDLKRHLFARCFLCKGPGLGRSGLLVEYHMVVKQGAGPPEVLVLDPLRQVKAEGAVGGRLVEVGIGFTGRGRRGIGLDGYNAGQKRNQENEKRRKIAAVHASRVSWKWE